MLAPDGRAGRASAGAWSTCRRRAAAGRCSCSNGAPRERVVEAALWAGFGRHPGRGGAAGGHAGRGATGSSRSCAARAAQLTRRRSARPGHRRRHLRDAAGPGGRGRRRRSAVHRPAGRAGAGGRRGARHRDGDRARRRGGRDGPVSIWARDPAQGERVARRLPSPSTWVGRHGIAATAVPTRIARHVVPRQLEWRAAWAPGTPELPTDDDLVAAQRTLTELRHGREARRWPALRAGARALVRTREERAVKVGAPPHPTSPLAHTPHGPRVPCSDSRSGQCVKTTTRCRSTTHLEFIECRKGLMPFDIPRSRPPRSWTL